MPHITANPKLVTGIIIVKIKVIMELSIKFQKLHCSLLPESLVLVGTSVLVSGRKRI
jgi:hypothetical protein